MKFRCMEVTAMKILPKCFIHQLKTRACNNFDNLSVFIFVKFTSVLEMKGTSGDVLPSGKVSKVP